MYDFDYSYFGWVIIVFLSGLLLINFFDKEMSKRKKELADIYINSDKYDIYKKCYKVDDIFYCERNGLNV